MVAVKIAAPRYESQPIMRLVRDEELAEVRHRRERRIFPRREVSLQAEGRRLDHSLSALRSPSLTLDLRDLSVGGLSALTDTVLIPGERIAVSFPPEGLRRGWAARGVVLRCDRAALGYRIAMEFECIPHAA